MTNSRTASFSKGLKFCTSCDKLKAVTKYRCTYLVEILRRIVSIKCSEVLQCSDDLSNKVSNIIRKYIDSMKLLLTYSFGSISFINSYMVVFLFNTLIYVFLLLCLCIRIVCLCIFIVQAGTFRLP